MPTLSAVLAFLNLGAAVAVLVVAVAFKLNSKHKAQ